MAKRNGSGGRPPFGTPQGRHSKQLNLTIPLELNARLGILILLVVIGHIVPENSILRTWIWSFHMPAFFIISGILINHSSFTKKSFSELIISSIKSLIIPFVIFEIIGAIADRIMHGSSLNVKGYIYIYI